MSKNSSSINRSQDVDISDQCCGVVKSCPGKGEIVLRTACLIALALMLISGFAGLGDFGRFVGLNEVTTAFKSKTNAALGWIVFVGIVSFVFEGLIVTSRFCCNIARCTPPLLAVDIVISFVVILAIACGTIPIAFYLPEAMRIRIISGGSIGEITSSMGATAAGGFLSIAMFLLLAVYMIFSLLLKCSNTSRRKYNLLIPKQTDDELSPSD